MASKNIGKARILQEIKNMQKEETDYLHAQPLQTDLYTWHFTFRGPENTDFHEGLYHGQILLPFEYPFKPPDIIFANKNGRFQINTKICLTITQYHTEEWNSAWTIRTMLEAVISLFNEKVKGHGYLESGADARQFFAKSSHDYVCEKCGKINQILKPRLPIGNKKQSFIAPSKEEQVHFNIPYKQLPIKTVSKKYEKEGPIIERKQKVKKYDGQIEKSQKLLSLRKFCNILVCKGNNEYKKVMQSKVVLEDKITK